MATGRPEGRAQSPAHLRVGLGWASASMPTARLSLLPHPTKTTCAIATATADPP
ncbi:unnamed protein product [Penicillium camemberti]|uniref:Str. FM013 n=1 Tax=Penicillium camemberti (strain FM 013) TaxID=1429867 RepID=A0A0G4P142_PENC3|nr:unnamed protein product [Penicillium camemberti]